MQTGYGASNLVTSMHKLLFEKEILSPLNNDEAIKFKMMSYAEEENSKKINGEKGKLQKWLLTKSGLMVIGSGFFVSYFV